jgi:transposase-like protein
METKRNRKKYDLEYKRRIVAEYLAGEKTAQEIAEREGLHFGQIYRWRVQLENRARHERIESIQADDPKVTLEQARRILELEEELEDYQKKVAQLTLENDLLKKLQPSYQSAKRSSGYIETKRSLGQSRRRPK